MPKNEQMLADYREQIDAIDNEILAALKKRVSVVKKVGKLKESAKSDKTIIRPGREARMIRKVAQHRDIGLPVAALAQMWRIIIAGAITIEEKAKIAVFDQTHQRECFWLAREYFGGFTPMSGFQTSKEVLEDVVQGSSTVAAIPLWDKSNTMPWWLDCAKNYPSLKVFARLPFIRFADSRLVPVVALAKVEPEDSGDDASLWVFKTKPDKAVDVIEPLLVKAGFSFYLQAVNQSPKANHYLVEVGGFVMAKSPEMKKVIATMGKEVLSARYLGSYANPLSFE